MKLIAVLLGGELHRLFKRKSFYMMYAVTLLISGLLIIQLIGSSQKGVTVPIGIVDKDQSEFSFYMIEQLKGNPLLKVVVLSEEDAERQVLDQGVEAVYVIPKGTQQKVDKGDLTQLVTVAYLDGNNFALMLTDIVSGDILDELCLKIAANYYDDAMSMQTDNYIPSEMNQVYLFGKMDATAPEENYYVNIDVIDSSDLYYLDITKQNIIVRKMTLGILFVLLGFFGIFAAVSHKIEADNAVGERLLGMGVKAIHSETAHILELIITMLLMATPMGLLFIVLKEGTLFELIIYLLYCISISGLIYFLENLLESTGIFILFSVSIFIFMGVISGSFFAVDLHQPLLLFLARLCPAFYSMNVFFDKSLIREYIIYTAIYFAVLSLLGLQLNYLKLRRKS